METALSSGWGTVGTSILASATFTRSLACAAVVEECCPALAAVEISLDSVVAGESDLLLREWMVILLF